MRRRQRLQVDTFPFLAVLLCAMGALILLLLVLDRRAKIVAAHKARQALAQLQEEQQQAAAARLAEWERRRQALRDQLRREEAGVTAELQAAQSQLQQATTAYAAEQTAIQHLKELAQSVQQALHNDAQGLADRQKALVAAEQRTARASAEVERLSAGLHQLERTLADLQAARRQQPPIYSVVPYRGKQGDNRRPVYVECQGNQVIFHPDRQVVDLPGGDVRAEVQRRLAGQAPGNAYLLFLVRPSGILTYYRTMSLLHGLPLDFGYEFIEADWQLEFPAADGRPPPQPALTASHRPATPPAPGTPDEAEETGSRRSLPAFAEAVVPRGAGLGRPVVSGLENSGRETKSQQAGQGVDEAVGAAQPNRPAPSRADCAPEHPGGPPSLLPLPAIASPPARQPAAGPPLPPAQGTKGSERETAASLPMDPLARLNSEKKPPPRPVLLGRDRSWIIDLECQADAIVLQPTGQRFALEQGNLLSEAVRHLISRRQATVRPGEAPYRPQLRFRVRPDGFRAYYHAYPALEELRLPMKRETLEPEDEGRK